MQTPYKLIVQFAGGLRWVCPFCGLLTRSKVTYGSYWIRCKASTCQQRYLVGITLHVPLVTQAKHIPPPDVVIPDSVQEAESTEVRPGQHLTPDAKCGARLWPNNGHIMHVEEMQVIDK
jgi:hypothetical protein